MMKESSFLGDLFKLIKNKYNDIIRHNIDEDINVIM